VGDIYAPPYISNRVFNADPGGRAVSGLRLRPVACWKCGFEARREYGWLSVASVVSSDREISETGRPECGVSGCDREALRRPWPIVGSWSMIE